MEDRLKIYTLLAAGFCKSEVGKSLDISKQSVHYHAKQMKNKGWLEEVKGTINPKAYKMGPNHQEPAILRARLFTDPHRGFVSKNPRHAPVNNFDSGHTGTPSKTPSPNGVVKNYRHTPVDNFYLECRIHDIQIGASIEKFEGDISSLPFLDGNPIKLANRVKKHRGLLTFNQEESYPVWLFNDKKLIIRLPTQTVYNAQQLRDWQEKAFRISKGVCDHLSREYGFEFGGLYISKAHYGFPDNEDVMTLNNQLQISTPDCWNDASMGKVEYEVNRLELALTFFEMPLKILRLEKQVKELRGDENG